MDPTASNLLPITGKDGKCTPRDHRISSPMCGQKHPLKRDSSFKVLGLQFAFEDCEQGANEPRKPKFDCGHPSKTKIPDNEDGRTMRQSFWKVFGPDYLNFENSQI